MSLFLADFPPSLGSAASAGEHYMIIDSFESANAVTSGDKKLSSIGLYIPAGSLKTGFKGNYNAKAGAETVAKMGQGLGMVGGAGPGGMEKKFDVGTLAAALKTRGLRAAAKFGDTGGFLSAQGKIPNNYTALVYEGPTEFRTHTFEFKFFPKNQDESNTVRAIIEEFRRGTLPRMANMGSGLLADAFFKSPRQHEIKFCRGGSGASGVGSENSYLFKIDTSVITEMSVNFDPQTTVGFHDDGSPVQIDLSLTFQEIKFQISPDNVEGQNLNLSGAVSQNQSSSQLTAEQTAQNEQLRQTGGSARILPGGRLSGGF